MHPAARKREDVHVGTLRGLPVGPFTPAEALRLVVEGLELQQVLVALHGRGLVGSEELLGALGERAGERGVAGLVIVLVLFWE